MASSFAGVRSDISDRLRCGPSGFGGGTPGSWRCLSVSLPRGDDRLAGVAMRWFGEERSRDQRQDCKRQEGRKWSVQPHHVLRGAERQSNSYLRESLWIV